MLDAATLLSQLIACPSITPDDANCQQILKKHLEALGFSITDLPCKKVSNFWAKRGNAEPLFVFAGHTDVVTPGDKNSWQFDPFQATTQDGYIYGRGAQDMKGPLAAMIIACEKFIKQYPEHRGSIAFLITSGEEGHDYMDGTPHVMNYLASEAEKITYCVVGEPSCQKQLGDTIRHGRRGSLHGYLIVSGKQGHVAYHHLADNPIHRAIPAIQKLIQTKWDEGNADFGPTSLQITSIESGQFGENNNVIPHELKLQFNFRYSPLSDENTIKNNVEKILNEHGLNYALTWELSGKPFITVDSSLRQAAVAAVQKVMNITPEFSTGGGTSDARFIAPTGAQVIELGVCNDRIHQINERVSIQELEQLSQIYYLLLELLLV
ncbi:MAG: succinyl-diaminopimelate desuccinylase [Legionellales bacterium]|jgi:succinyl-diaminopimelate desuccinylase